MAEATDLAMDFTIEWDDPATMNLRTACCCCFCACDDCDEFIKVQTEMICLWLEMREQCQCCQCSDDEDPPVACCEGALIGKELSMRNEESNLVCVNAKANGYCCCCAKGVMNYGCCDPCGAPESCIKGQSQLFCIHQRCALPPDDDVPFEIAILGFSLVGGPEKPME